MKKLILAAALVAPLAAPALAQELGTGFVGTPEREAVTQAPREFTARRLIEPRQHAPAQTAPVQVDRNAVPSSALSGAN